MATAHTRRSFLKISSMSLAAAYLASCSFGGSQHAAEKGLRAAFNQPINDLDPHGPSSVDESTLLAGRLIYDTPLQRRGDELVPSVATSWEQTDPNTWVLTLRDDVTFHDGSPLTASDVKASLERVRDAGTAQSALWSSVTDVEVPDDHTVRIITDTPLGTMPVNLTLLFILPADKMNDEGFFRKPIGSGPFKVESFTPSSVLELSATDYWNGRPKLNTVTLPYIPETSSQITALRTGELSVLWPVPSDQIQELEGTDDITLETVPSYAYYFMWFNCGREPFTDPRVRRAMWKAVDISTIVENLFREGAEQMTAPIPSTVFGHAPQEPYPYDPEAAKRELAEAGLGDGFRTSLMWFSDTGPLADGLAQTMISDWAKIGITVEPHNVEKAEWLRRLNAKEFDMELQINTVTTGDADFTLGRLYDSSADRMGYANPELDSILRQAHSDSDQQKRRELYAKACEIIWNDAVGIFPATLISTYGMRSTVKGFEPVASNQPDLRDVTLED
ncbi:ABC transporter substrate-binding protein [Saccharomonospora viridis]|jgi:peptide/nickel transport system substrate-binding protein|uniref:ABC-type dipeptide transport system, periplasmic component n=2 Tax=Saccharomonospora viridis TaxID=1852 RepID=C7MPX6_SACVD|nr:ABC transporter substrate-binding protein [Saccharomonospora viridis]ACU96371.1 ABC-type dipeptide transport system, periplasmic component [Saccharomonospora viridis DSM 43017]SFO98129.1 peptide/nickel transport system substrate-binding protein [Saccharomonospora viridis]